VQTSTIRIVYQNKHCQRLHTQEQDLPLGVGWGRKVHIVVRNCHEAPFLRRVFAATPLPQPYLLAPLPNAICDAATRETRRLLCFLGAKPTNRAVCGGSYSRKRADIQLCLSLCVCRTWLNMALWVLCVDESSTSNNQATFKASRFPSSKADEK
jgi:hypothetical protein